MLPIASVTSFSLTYRKVILMGCFAGLYRGPTLYLVDLPTAARNFIVDMFNGSVFKYNPIISHRKSVVTPLHKKKAHRGPSLPAD